MHAKFIAQLQTIDGLTFIKLYDCFAELGGKTKTVTNDAERVVTAALAAHGDHRIFYRDSMKQWGELVHENGQFKSFGYCPLELRHQLRLE